MAPCATVSSEGIAGRQDCFWVPWRDWYTTLTFTEQRTLWGVGAMALAPGSRGAAQLANGFDPAVSQGVGDWLFCVLDSVVCYNALLARPLPPRPTCRSDVISPKFGALVARWVANVLSYTRRVVRQGTGLLAPPLKPIIFDYPYLP